MNGWIKLHRRFLDWEWYDDINTKALFIHLLLSATHEPTRHHGRDLLPGQLITGRVQLSKQLHLSEQNIRTSMERLKSTKEITTEVTNKFTIISIVKWAKYQLTDEECNQQNNQPPNQRLTNNQPTTNQQVTTFKKGRNKEAKKEEEYTLFNTTTTAGACAREDIPFQKVLSLWNDICIFCNHVEELPQKRKELIAARWTGMDTGLDDMTAMFCRVNESPYLTGKGAQYFEATFDWVLDELNWTKIREGNYDMSFKGGQT